MSILMNFAFAWLGIILTVILAIVYLTRVFSKGESKFAVVLKIINKKSRKYHKELGILLILVGLIHGLLSSESVFTLNMGTISWIVSILLGLNFMLKKNFNKYCGWMYYHRLLTVAFLATIVLHVVDVGGIQVHYVVQSYLSKGSETVATLDSKAIENIASGFEGATFKDGVYTGEATGYRPGLKVSVTVSDNKITEIKVTEHNEVNSRFYQKPIDTIPPAIIQSQSLDVDTVSGATMTSVGIINAVNNALSQAIENGSLPETKELPQGGHGGKEKFRVDRERSQSGSSSFPSESIPQNGIRY